MARSNTSIDEQKTKARREPLTRHHYHLEHSSNRDSSLHFPGAEIESHSILLKARLAVSTTFFILGILCASWMSRLPALQEHHHVGPGLLSLALLCSGGGAVTTMPFAGRLCNTFGSRPLTIIFCLTLVSWGIASSLMNVNMNAHAVLVERFYKRPIMSSFHGLFSVGCMTGALLGSVLAKYAVVTQVHLLFVSAFCLLIACVLRPLFLPADLDKHRSEQDSGSRQERYTLEPVIVALSAMTFCCYLSEGAIADWSAIYMRQSLHTTESLAALGYGTFGIAMCLGRLFGGKIVQRLGPVASVRCGAILAMLGLASALIGHSAVMSLVGFAGVGLGFSTIVPTLYSTAGRSSSNTGRAIATLSMCGYIGLLVGPPIIGFTAEFTNLPIALSMICFLGLVLTLLANFAKPTPAIALHEARSHIT